MFEVSDRKGIESLSLELCDTEKAFQKVCVLPHSTLSPTDKRSSLVGNHAPFALYGTNAET